MVKKLCLFGLTPYNFLIFGKTGGMEGKPYVRDDLKNNPDFDYLSFFLQSCAPTQQRRDVVKTAFLSNYSILTEGKGDHETLLHYINPDAD